MMSWDDRKALFCLVSVSHCTLVGRLDNRQAPGKLKPWNLHNTDSNETREVVVGATGGDLLCYWDGAIAKGVSLYDEEKEICSLLERNHCFTFREQEEVLVLVRLFNLVCCTSIINHWMRWLNSFQIRRLELLTILVLETIIIGFMNHLAGMRIWICLHRL